MKVGGHVTRCEGSNSERIEGNASRQGERQAYAREPTQRFAKLRGIEFIKAILEKVRSQEESLSRVFERRIENVPQVEIHQPQRSIFAGFKPPPMSEAIERVRSDSSWRVSSGVERYARATQDIARMRDTGLSPMPHQEAAFEKTRASLNQMHPKAGRDLAEAFAREPGLVGEAASGNPLRALQAMQLEAEIRTNPGLRADRWVQDWNRYNSLREKASNAPDFVSADRWGNKLENLANQLHRDPQIDSLIAIRMQELGLYGRTGSGGISHDLLMSIGRGRGIGISM